MPPNFSDAATTAQHHFNIIFVTGTDTGVGKTCVCGLLVDYLQKAGLNTMYQKWAATGGLGQPDDLRDCLSFCEKPPPSIPLDRQIPFRYKTPVSPHLAAELEKAPPVDPAILKEQCLSLAGQHEVLVVEGVGGLLVPLHRGLLLADLVGEMGLNTLIVARSGLGTINHTLLTIEAARSRGINILGIIFSDNDTETDKALIEDNMKTVAETGKVKVFGRLPRFQDQQQARQLFSAIGAKILPSYRRPE